MTMIEPKKSGVESASSHVPTINPQFEFGHADLQIEDELTIGADEIELTAESEAATSDANADEIEMPHLDPNLQAPIELDAALSKDLHSIPQKMAFKIGEAAEMVGVKQYVLRYWETEFDSLRPRKSSNGQRIYSRKDVETAMMIKKLLYNDRFSIEGARSALRHLKSTVKTSVQEEKNSERFAKNQESVASLMRSLIGDIRRVRATL